MNQWWLRNKHQWNFIKNQKILFDQLQLKNPISWWSHQMEKFSVLVAICAENSPVADEFPAQRPVTRSFDVFFELRLNKRSSKQSWGCWFETLSRLLWCHCNMQNGGQFSCLRLRQWPVTYLITLSDWIMSCQPGRHAVVTVCEPDWKHKWAAYKSFDETSSFNNL